MSLYGQTEKLQMLESTSLEHEFGCANVAPFPGLKHSPPSLSPVSVALWWQPLCSLNTPFIIILPGMAAEIWREIWIQVGSSVCIQALARVLQAGWTRHWSWSVEGTASSEELRKKIHPAHYFDAFTGSAFYSSISLRSSVAPASPFVSFKPRKHLRNNTSVKRNTAGPNVSLIN